MSSNEEGSLKGWEEIACTPQKQASRKKTPAVPNFIDEGRKRLHATKTLVFKLKTVA